MDTRAAAVRCGSIRRRANASARGRVQHGARSRKWDENFYTGRIGGRALIEDVQTPGKSQRREAADVRLGPAGRAVSWPADRRAWRIARRLSRASDPFPRSARERGVSVQSRQHRARHAGETGRRHRDRRRLYGTGASPSVSRAPPPPAAGERRGGAFTPVATAVGDEPGACRLRRPLLQRRDRRDVHRDRQGWPAHGAARDRRSPAALEPSRPMSTGSAA